MPGMLEGKITLVTGGAQGVGRAACLLFAREGAKIVLCDVLARGGEETVSLVKQAGGEAAFFKTDISKEQEVKALIEAAVGLHGRLDCAFNCAGVDGDPSPLHECTNENWDRVIDINLRGMWHLMKFEIPQMVKQGKGSIVNIGSVCGVVGLECWGAYGASRFGNVGLTKCAALEYARQGVRVNQVGPGSVRTAIFERMTGGNTEMIEYIKQMHPMGRVAEPEEVAEAALWLLSDRSSFTTGHMIMVDGGLTAR
ncbi:MAG: SDR family oxidoreductase [Syntrophaceae bacterium]